MKQVAAIQWILILYFTGCASFVKVSLSDCKTQIGIPGPEDIDIEFLPGDSARLIVSSQERRKMDPAGEMAEPGGIFYMPIIAGNPGIPELFEIRDRDEMPFHPHGISLIKSGNETLLFVVNHFIAGNHSVELFQIKDNALIFKRRFRSELMNSPNDIVAAGPEEFYVSNDKGSSGGLSLLTEMVFSLRWSTVVHYRAGVWDVAVRDIAFANGLAISKNGRSFYAAGVLDKGIHVFPRDAATGNIGKRQTFFDVGSGVDNLIWEDENTLLVAAHPDFFAFLRHLKNSQEHSPSEIYRINARNGVIDRIFADDGQLIDAASTGLAFRGRLYIAQVFDPEVVSCSYSPVAR